MNKFVKQNFKNFNLFMCTSEKYLDFSLSHISSVKENIKIFTFRKPTSAENQQNKSLLTYIL